MSFRYLPDVTTLVLDGELCSGCRMCSVVCPHAVFDFDGGKAVLADRDACMECGACAKNCPEGALSVRPGVGCAYAIIMGWFHKSEPCCGPVDDSGGGSGCCG